jgi:hypothetical protein
VFAGQLVPESVFRGHLPALLVLRREASWHRTTHFYPTMNRIQDFDRNVS